MAKALAAHFNTVWTPEFARHYLEHIGQPYQQKDLHTIAKGQAAWEKWFSFQARTAFFCDTDWTVLKVWEEFRFSKGSNENWYWQSGYPKPQLADLYFLCMPDIPWEPDSLRENAQEREVLFELYWNLLQDQNANFAILEGGHQERLLYAISKVNKLLSTLP